MVFIGWLNQRIMVSTGKMENPETDSDKGIHHPGIETKYAQVVCTGCWVNWKLVFWISNLKADEVSWVSSLRTKDTTLDLKKNKKIMLSSVNTSKIGVKRDRKVCWSTMMISGSLAGSSASIKKIVSYLALTRHTHTLTTKDILKKWWRLHWQDLHLMGTWRMEAWV